MIAEGQRPPLSCRTSPPQGGDWPSSLISQPPTFAKRTLSAKLPISPLVGEMSGRTEGARRIATERFYSGPLYSSAEVTAWIPGSAPRRFAPRLPWDDEVEGCFGQSPRFAVCH
ncbi:MAG: hypothetical protein E5Y63_25425 [Mesorhizobium sp.]|nr:MAG: hypothetical protein E5Y63_25425 [Mesorhizobium sp.]